MIKQREIEECVELLEYMMTLKLDNFNYDLISIIKSLSLYVLQLKKEIKELENGKKNK